ncbi:MAG TPA: FAD-dependent oxidoreductase [Acidobacteriota bacterium]|nr:FAD-dependent oxidoreductase [Acidobacteriota bacterium]
MLKTHLRQSAFSEVQNEGRILGGNDQLPKAFARKLSDKILYNRPVRKISHDPQRAEVWFEEEGTTRSIRAPWLVIAIPFSVLRQIEITPAFSDSKMRCLHELAYGHVMKTRYAVSRKILGQAG